MSTGEKNAISAASAQRHRVTLRDVTMAPRVTGSWPPRKETLSEWEKLREWIQGQRGSALLDDASQARNQFLHFFSHNVTVLGLDVDLSSARDWRSAIQSPESPREETEQLRSQVEALKSRVLQERRTAARETQRYDQLAVELGALRTTLERMLDRLKQRDEANNALVSALVAKGDGRLRMTEVYEGEAIHVSDDSVVVVFDVRGDLIEQTYVREQFLDGQLPEKGDRLAA